MDGLPVDEYRESNSRSSFERAVSTRGFLEAIDMDSYRNEKQASMRIILKDTDAVNGSAIMSQKR
jgi:hypothetical protein